MGFNKKIALTVASSAVGALMLAGGSFAMFTAATPTAMSTFAAGTVDITPNVPCNLGSSDFSNLEPGDAGSGTIDLKNSGSLDEWVNLNTELSHSGSNPDIFSGYTGDDYPLSVNYTVQIENSSGTPYTTAQYSGDSQTNNSPVNFFASGSSDQVTLGDEGSVQSDTLFLPAGDTAVISYTWSFPLAAGNDYQNASGTVTMGATAVQASNNINSGATGPNVTPSSTLSTPSAQS